MKVHILPLSASSAAALCRRVAAVAFTVMLAHCEHEEPPIVVQREVQPVIVARMPAQDPTRGSESVARSPQAAAPDAPPASSGTSVNHVIDVAHAVTTDARSEPAAAEAQQATPSADGPAGSAAPADSTGAEDDDVVVIGGAGGGVKTLPPQGDVAVIGASEPPDSSDGASEGAAAVGDGADPSTDAVAAVADDSEAPSQGEGQRGGMQAGVMTAEAEEARAIDAVVSGVETAVAALNRDPQEAKEAFIGEIKAQAADLRARIGSARQRISQLSPAVGTPGDRAKQQALFQLDQLRGRLDRATSRF